MNTNKIIPEGFIIDDCDDDDNDEIFDNEEIIDISEIDSLVLARIYDNPIYNLQSISFLSFLQDILKK
jgi:hypothetical protein